VLELNASDERGEFDPQSRGMARCHHLLYPTQASCLPWRYCCKGTFRCNAYSCVESVTAMQAAP
jgi:hypothetical protein